jgi:hypothetical protein
LKNVKVHEAEVCSATPARPRFQLDGAAKRVFLLTNAFGTTIFCKYFFSHLMTILEIPLGSIAYFWNGEEIGIRLRSEALASTTDHLVLLPAMAPVSTIYWKDVRHPNRNAIL